MKRIDIEIDFVIVAIAIAGVIIGIWLVLAAGCAPREPVHPVAVPSCIDACDRLVAFECPEGDPSPEQGNTCETVCTRYHALDYMKPWASCVQGAADVEEVRACGVHCER
jgi:hypothetical protein